MRVERISAAALLAALWLAVPSARAQPAEDDAEALLGQAAQQLSAGDAKTALELCDMALSLAPSDGRVLAQLAQAHLRLGQLDAAIADATRAQALLPGKASPYTIRSEAYFQEGRFKEALADRKQAADLDPVNLAQHQAALKRRPQASPPPAAAKPTVAAARPASPPGRKKRLALAVGAAALAGLLAWLTLAILAARRRRPQITRYAEPGLKAPDAGEPSPGAVIAGELILGGLVARKAYVSVYDGRDLGDRALVVKRLHLGSGQEGRLRQALALAALRDPHLVPVEGVYEHKGERYLAHEPVEGQTLRALLAKAPWHRLDIPQCLRILESVCAALGRAHEAGVFISPLDFSTIFVRRDGSALVEVVDAFAGSQAGAEESSELRALEDCLFELATGKPADPGSAAGLPAGLGGFFSRAFSADVRERFQSEAEFLAALRELAAARRQG